MPERVNHLAAIVAAFIYFAWGALYYGIFGHQWLALVGKTADQLPNGPVVPYVASFALGLILSYATAIALTRRPEDQTVQQGVGFALFMGIGLYATQTLNHVLYEGSSTGLWLINTAYTVIGFAIVGAIVGGWRKKAAAGGA